MVFSFNDLRCKEIINVKNGARLGYPDDIEFENCTAKICRIIVFGNLTEYRRKPVSYPRR